MIYNTVVVMLTKNDTKFHDGYYRNISNYYNVNS